MARAKDDILITAPGPGGGVPNASRSGTGTAHLPPQPLGLQPFPGRDGGGLSVVGEAGAAASLIDGKPGGLPIGTSAGSYKRWAHPTPSNVRSCGIEVGFSRSKSSL